MIQELFGASKKSVDHKRDAFSKADLIISVSESTKSDLLRIYPEINPSKVSVCYHGISDIFLEKSKFIKNLGRPYVLYVGARKYGYKNFDFLLDTFIEKKYYLDFDLVLVGGEMGMTESQKIKIEKTTRQGTWLSQKFPSDYELKNLYEGAEVFIYPSLYEGFGIPLLEAMASSCPILSSNSSSLPEVIGDAGLLFDPHDKEDFINKLERILKNHDLSAELIKRGRQRSMQFTWETAAEKIYEEYLKFG